MSDIRPSRMMLDRVVRLARDPFWDVPVKVLLSAGLMGLLAPISLGADGPVPITLQTFIILVLSYLLGPRKALFATGLYLLAGGLGLPVFAGGSAGWAKFIGPTGGFLFAFLLSAWLVGFLAAQKPRASLGRISLIMLLGHLLILGKGMIWLGVWRGWEGWADIALGLLPGAALKTAAAALLLWSLQAGFFFILRRTQSHPSGPPESA